MGVNFVSPQPCTTLQLIRKYKLKGTGLFLRSCPSGYYISMYVRQKLVHNRLTVQYGTADKQGYNTKNNFSLSFRITEPERDSFNVALHLPHVLTFLLP